MTGYVVIVERSDDGCFGAWSPDLPGCIATSRDYDICVAEMRDAVRFHLDGMREDGLDIPEPSAVGALTVDGA